MLWVTFNFYIRQLSDCNQISLCECVLIWRTRIKRSMPNMVLCLPSTYSIKTASSFTIAVIWLAWKHALMTPTKQQEQHAIKLLVSIWRNICIFVVPLTIFWIYSRICICWWWWRWERFPVLLPVQIPKSQPDQWMLLVLQRCDSCDTYNNRMMPRVKGHGEIHNTFSSIS